MLRVRPLLQVLAVLEPRALQQLQQQVGRPHVALLSAMPLCERWYSR
jgi:hypothetical protein